MSGKGKFLIPDTIPATFVCRTLFIPDDIEIRAAINGQLSELLYPETWEQTGTATPDEIAAVMDTMFWEYAQSECANPEERMTEPILISDQKTQNTAGGTATAGAWQKRTLNVLADLFPHGASLSNSEFTLPIGRWMIKWACPAYKTGVHQSRLWSVTENSAIQSGSSEDNNSADNTQTRSFGVAIQNNGAPTTYRIEHRVAVTRATDGFGRPANFSGEVYTLVECWLLPQLT